MTFAFDGGAAEAQDTRIQRAVLDLFADLRYQEEDIETPHGPYLRTLEPIPEPPDVEYMELQRAEFMRRMPGALIYLGGGARVPNNEGVSGRRARFDRELLLVIFAGRATNAVEGRLDETDKLPTDNRDDPGIRVILEHMIQRLEGAQLDTEGVMAPIVVDGFMPLETRTDWTSWGIRCTIRVEVTACSPDTRAAEPLDVIRAKHDIQDAGVVAIQEEEVKP